MRLNSSSTVSLKDHSVGLIFILIGLRKILVHVDLIYVGKSFKGMTIHKIQIHIKCLKFQGLSARSQRWFDIYFDWIEVNFITREPDLYKETFSNP